MLKVLSILALTLASTAAFAATTVPYNQWTWLSHCNVSTRLTCHGPRQNNQCQVEFSGYTSCSNADFYVGSDFYPVSGVTANLSTYSTPFYVDNSKVSEPYWFGQKPTFQVFLHTPDKSSFEQIIYKFDY